MNNVIFKKSAADAAIERLKKKLGRTNSGLDPELLADMAAVAGFHVKASMRDIVKFASAMVDNNGSCG